MRSSKSMGLSAAALLLTLLAPRAWVFVFISPGRSGYVGAKHIRTEIPHAPFAPKAAQSEGQLCWALPVGVLALATLPQGRVRLRPVFGRICMRAQACENEFADEEEEGYYIQLVVQLARDLLSLVPVVGPALDAVDAAKKGDMQKYVLSFLWLFADVFTLGAAEEARTTALAASEAGRLARLGQKGVQLRKLAAAAKKTQAMKELSGQVRWALKVIEMVCNAKSRLDDNRDEDDSK